MANTPPDPLKKLTALERMGYTADDIAALVPCSTRMVRRLDALRAIPGRYTVGLRLVRWHRQQVDEWIAAGCPVPGLDRSLVDVGQNLLTEGERRKAEAFDHFESHRSQLLLLGRRAMLVYALQHGKVTADEVRALVPLPAGIDPKAFGAVPGVLSKLGLIEPFGFQHTTRAAGHARPVRVWRIRDAEAARRWLNDHPDPMREVES